VRQPLLGGHVTKHRSFPLHRSSPPSYLPIGPCRYLLIVFLILRSFLVACFACLHVEGSRDVRTWESFAYTRKSLSVSQSLSLSLVLSLSHPVSRSFSVALSLSLAFSLSTILSLALSLVACNIACGKRNHSTLGLRAFEVLNRANLRRKEEVNGTSVNSREPEGTAPISLTLALSSSLTH